jgi:hypothetical protein
MDPLSRDRLASRVRTRIRIGRLLSRVGVEALLPVLLRRRVSGSSL